MIAREEISDYPKLFWKLFVCPMLGERRGVFECKLAKHLDKYNADKCTNGGSVLQQCQQWQNILTLHVLNSGIYSVLCFSFNSICLVHVCPGFLFSFALIFPFYTQTPSKCFLIAPRPRRLITLSHILPSLSKIFL